VKYNCLHDDNPLTQSSARIGCAEKWGV
jgi:hypothetical protein